MKNEYKPFEVVMLNSYLSEDEARKVSDFYFMQLSTFEFELRQSSSWVKVKFDLVDIDEQDIFSLDFSENIHEMLKTNIERSVPKTAPI